MFYSTSYSLLSVKGHNNPLDKEGYVGKSVTLSCVCVKNAFYQSLKASHTNDLGLRATHSYRTSKFPVFIICPVYGFRHSLSAVF